MKIKSHNINEHSVSIERIKKLGFDWHELFNPSLAIHANRELNMSKIRLVGFDMDYTLAVYKKRPMEFWQYELARHYLVKNMNYPDALYASNYNADLVIRGLVIDKHLGNILKVDDQNFVWRAVFGKTPLVAHQISEIYGTKRIKISGERFYSLDTFFSIPEAGLFIDTIECLERLKKSNLPQGRWSTEQGHINFFQVFTDIRFAMDSIHSNGSLKTLIRDRIEEFIEQDAGIGQALIKLRQEGKKTFLLTNSSFDYSNTVLSYVFKNQLGSNKSWLELFDWVIVEAEKPKFFTEQRSFLPLAEGHTYPGKIIERRGNIHDFQQLTKVHGSQTLYVGDHIYGDVLRSKKESLWRTCLIIKELKFDIKKSLELKQEMKSLRDIHHKQSQINRRLMRLRTLLTIVQNPSLQLDKKAHEEGMRLAFDLKTEIGLATNTLQKLEAKDVELNRLIEDHFHPLWGRLFKEDRELSRFGAQVRQYACLYTDHVKNFLHYDAAHTFFARKATMSHEIEDE